MARSRSVPFRTRSNLLAATTAVGEAAGQVYNVAFGQQTTLSRLFELMRAEVAKVRPAAAGLTLTHRPFRDGDIRHSLADTSRARRRLLGYAPTVPVKEGIVRSAKAYAPGS